MTPSASQPPYTAARIRALIVEDRELLAHAFRNLMEADPAYEVVATAESADAALRCVETCEPQIVFLDWSLPRHGAEVACRQMRARAKPPRIIALLDDDHSAYRRAAMVAGADHAIGKPDLGDVLGPLARCLGAA